MAWSDQNDQKCEKFLCTRSKLVEQDSLGKEWGHDEHSCEWQKRDQSVLSDFPSLPFCTRINSVKVTNSWCRSME